MTKRITYQTIAWLMAATAGAPGAFAQQTPAVPLPAAATPAAPVAPASGAPSAATVPLPSVATLPAKPESGAAAPAGTAEAEATEKVEKKFSFGGSDVSILFLPQQVSRMKDAIISYETAGHASTVVVQPTPTITQPTEVIKDPAEYPVFYLSSIAYRNPGEWSIWLAGHKISSYKNDTDVKVVSVSAESVTLTWLPEYVEAVKRRKSGALFASVDAVKNKLSTQQRISMDDVTGAVTFTLRQNQSFSLGYFSIFEGYIESPQMIPLTVQTNNPNNISLTPDPSGSPGDPAMPSMQHPGQTPMPPNPGAMPGAAPPAPSNP